MCDVSREQAEELGKAWFPRPRGAAPHGPGGVPKRWNHLIGAWESSHIDKDAAKDKDHIPRLVPRPRGAVSCSRPSPACPFCKTASSASFILAKMRESVPVHLSPA